MVAAIAADESHAILFLVDYHPVAVHFLFVDPALVMKRTQQ
jgi:hypothetical protein